MQQIVAERFGGPEVLVPHEVPDPVAAGARVVAVARDERKLAPIRTLGPDAVIDSEAPDRIAQARAALGGAGATVVLDDVGGAVGEAAFTPSPASARCSSPRTSASASRHGHSPTPPPAGSAR